jgi:hypothetical protein
MRIRVQQKASYSFHFIYIPMHDHTFPNHKTFLLYHDSKQGTRSKDTISRIILENIAVGIIIVIAHNMVATNPAHSGNPITSGGLPGRDENC